LADEDLIRIYKEIKEIRKEVAGMREQVKYLFKAIFEEEPYSDNERLDAKETTIIGMPTNYLKTCEN